VSYRSTYVATLQQKCVNSELRRLSVLLHEADAQLFRKMINDKEHCIHQLLPPKKNSTHETSCLYIVYLHCHNVII